MGEIFKNTLTEFDLSLLTFESVGIEAMLNLLKFLPCIYITPFQVYFK